MHFFRLIIVGRGPKTFFTVGSDLPIHSNNGEIIPYSDTCISDGTQFNCDIGIPKMGLGGVPKRDVIITLPGDLTIHDIKWLSLYCIRFKVSFGDIMLNTVPGNYLIFQFEVLASQKLIVIV